MRPPANLAGRRFGHLTALEATNQRRRGGVVWRCVCDCGTECYPITEDLRSGDKTSCGCRGAVKRRRKATHGGHVTRSRQSLDEYFTQPVRVVDATEKAWRGAEEAASTLASLWGFGA